MELISGTTEMKLSGKTQEETMRLGQRYNWIRETRKVTKKKTS